VVVEEEKVLLRHLTAAAVVPVDLELVLDFLLQ
jgi:hypothetical protein